MQNIGKEFVLEDWNFSDLIR